MQGVYIKEKERIYKKNMKNYTLKGRGKKRSNGHAKERRNCKGENGKQRSECNKRKKTKENERMAKK